MKGFQTWLLVLATSTCVAADRDDWHLVYGPTRPLRVICITTLHSPAGKLNECEIYSAFPPDFGHQHPGKCSLYVNGRLFYPDTIVEESSYHRPLLFAKIPGYFSDHTNLMVSVDLEITLVGRHLKPGPMAGPPAPVQYGELELALKETRGLDFNSPDFGTWLVQQGLRRKSGETAITFARRACDFAGHHIKWVYPPPRAKLSVACNFTEGDCGSFSQLFVGICRANGIPARSLTGLWVSPGTGRDGHADGGGAGHAKSEFYAAGVGWVPVDANNLLFGEEGFNFLAMIVGDELPRWQAPQVGSLISTLQSPMIVAVGGAGAGASQKCWAVTTDLNLNEQIAHPAGKNMPPLPDVYLGELAPLKATIGWGSLGQDHSVGGNPLAIDGWQFEHGIGTHAPSELVYDLRPEYKRLVAVMGVDDEMSAGSPASVTFQVYFDGQLAKETFLVRPRQAVPLNLPVPEGKSRVRLVVTDGGDGANSDHADWCNAGFITTSTQSKVDPTESLKAIKDSLDKGLISPEDYNQKKKEIMDSL